MSTRKEGMKNVWRSTDEYITYRVATIGVHLHKDDDDHTFYEFADYKDPRPIHLHRLSLVGSVPPEFHQFLSQVKSVKYLSIVEWQAENLKDLSKHLKMPVSGLEELEYFGPGNLTTTDGLTVAPGKRGRDVLQPVFWYADKLTDVSSLRENETDDFVVVPGFCDGEGPEDEEWPKRIKDIELYKYAWKAVEAGR